MTKHVVFLKPDDTVKKALELLTEKGVSGVPVVSKGRVVGVLSQSDLVRFIDHHSPKIYYRTSKLFPLVLALVKSKDDFAAIKKVLQKMASLKVRDLMVRKVLTIDAEEDVLIAANKMAKNHVNRLPVVDKRKRLCGIIARADIIRALALG